MAMSTVIPTDSKRVIEVVQTCKSRKAIVISDLPFYIRITNIMVPSYSPQNVPPIGLAIVGINNYIL
jgi:hypothetical protein